MTLDELMQKVLEILPDASFGEDEEGQVIIYTNLQQTGGPDVELLEMEA